MNKQEVIKRVEQMGEYERFVDEPVSKKSVLDIVSKIDEPQKPVVPKFVADLYESIKDDFEDKVYDLCFPFNRDNGELSSEVREWFDCGKNEPIQTLVKMKLYGYTIEQEKLYTVEIPDPHGPYEIRYLLRNSAGNICIGVANYKDIFLDAKTHLTESEIKKDFEWAWQFAKPVEDK